MSRSLCLVLTVVIVLLAGGPASALPAEPATEMSAAERAIAADIFARANDERALRGIEALAWDPALAFVASDWAHQVAAMNQRVHRPKIQAVTYQAPFNLRHLWWIDENIYQGSGDGYSNAGAAHLSWMQSEAGHRQALLDPGSSAIGIGIACVGGTLWAVQNLRWRQYDYSGRPDQPVEPIARPIPDGPDCATTATTSLGFDLPARPAVGGRIWGPTRIDTAVALSRSLRHNPEANSQILIARADDPADATAASAVAGGGPLLLTWTDDLPEPTRQEITRLLATGIDPQVIILGGTKAVSAGVEAELAALTGTNPVRLAGTDRYGTAAALSTHGGGWPASVTLVDGGAWADALAAANLSSDTGSGWDSGWLLLTADGTLPPATGQALRAVADEYSGVEVTIAASGAVKPGLIEAVSDIIGRRPTVRTATDPAQLSALLAAERQARAAELPAEFGAISPALVARSDDFADALAGAGGLSATEYGTVLLTPGALPPAAEVLTVAAAAGDLLYIGGTKALSHELVEAFAGAHAPLLERAGGYLAAWAPLGR